MMLFIVHKKSATAYWGLERTNPKPNEIILITTAAGAVGHIVGQLAKAKGLTVIGVVGSDDKLNWCKELGFDHVFNYKTHDVFAELQKVAPDGVDIYFDHVKLKFLMKYYFSKILEYFIKLKKVGGEYYHNVINNHLRQNGRVLVCGSIENYNDVDVKLCIFRL